jgi:hypothetical protein
MRFALTACALTFALGTGGCWYAALQLAPLGLQAAEAVGGGAVNLVAKAAAATHSSSHSDNEGDRKAGEDEIDREERCDELQLEVPGVIELRQSGEASGPEWRELRLANSDFPQWEVLQDKDSAQGGWRPAINLLKMSFTPPLEGSLKPGVPNYLAYAPAEPKTSIEQDQLVALTVDFGTGNGTFQWNGRRYQYAVVRNLPCFPAPIAMK